MIEEQTSPKKKGGRKGKTSGKPSIQEPAEPKAKGRKLPPYQPGTTEPFPLSRNKVSHFLQCARCFYLDVRHKITPPSGPPLTLNGAVDKLLKAEFDHLRETQQPHPELIRAGVSAVPFQHPDLKNWRSNFKGARVLHKPTGFEIYGAIDDLLMDPSTGKIHVIDFKCTAKKDDVTCLEGGFAPIMKRQIEFYAFILSKLGLDVSDKAFIFYANGCADRPGFNAKLDFRISVVPHQCDTSWIEPTLRQIKDVLEAPKAPEPSEECGHCKYLAKVKELDSKKHPRSHDGNTG